MTLEHAAAGLTAFTIATAVRRLGPGRYRGFVDDSWNMRPHPLGGLITAIALRAMIAQFGDPTQSLRTVHTAFIAPVSSGELEISVEILRRGRTLSQLRAEVRNAGASHGHVTTAVFGASRDGFTFAEVAPPVVPAPRACLSYRDFPADDIVAEPMPIWERCVEQRLAHGHEPGTEWGSGPASQAVWFRFDEPPLDSAGVLDPLAVIALSDTMPRAVSERVGPSSRRWYPPSADLTVHAFEECRSTWLLSHNQARCAADGYASAEVTMWDCGEDGAAPPRLLAYATQVMLFSFLEDTNALTADR